MNFPVLEIKDELIRCLSVGNNAILQAPTGSGKSTLIPQIILDYVVPSNKIVIVLQPRRIATRMLANYISELRGTDLGTEVGYQIRLENNSNTNTRILFLTEGILLQKLLHGEDFQNVGAIIFDEFHERHIETDLSLGLTLNLQNEKQPRLKIIVMSATLESNELQTYLKGCPVIRSEGKSYPVEIKYQSSTPNRPIWESVKTALESNMSNIENGSALVFLPGTFEIQKTVEYLKQSSGFTNYEIVPLYSSLAKKEQDSAIKSKNKKIIVSTNVAETSLTIPGVKLVIDSGTARIARYDSKRGINTLFTENICKSSANQRSGRAGRTSPGVCIRLWSEFSHDQRADFLAPEIHRIDLSGVILGLLATGISNPATFNWITKPSENSVISAFNHLKLLGAVSASNEITSLGEQMAKFSTHPRISRIIAETAESGLLAYGCLLAALSQSQGLLLNTADEIIHSERKYQFGDTYSDSIFELKAWYYAYQKQFSTNDCKHLLINTQIARQVEQLTLQLIQSAQQIFGLKQIKLPDNFDYTAEVPLRMAIFKGFSDFLGIRHTSGSNTCQLLNNKSGQLDKNSCLQNTTYFVATELEESRTPTGIQLKIKKATAINEDWIYNNPGIEIIKKVQTTYQPELKKVVQITNKTWDGLILKRNVDTPDNPDEVAEIWTNLIIENKIQVNTWTEELESFTRRVNFCSKNAPQYQIPLIDTDAKKLIWLHTVYGINQLSEIQKCSPRKELKGWLSIEQQQLVDYLAPESIELPHRKRPVKLRYEENGDVVLSETIQALYDCPLPITVAEGKVNVIFELLSPARRPVQITRDLEQFWKNSYHLVKKELKGRYPKHEWR